MEVSLNLNQKPLLEFCKKLDIVVTAYSPLGRLVNHFGVKNLWDTPVVQELCAKYNKTGAQIACRFIVSWP